MLSSEGECFHTVIPVRFDGKVGNSTYSVGVVTTDYQLGFDTFGLPAKTCETRTLDWICDIAPNAA